MVNAGRTAESVAVMWARDDGGLEDGGGNGKIEQSKTTGRRIWL